MIPKQLDLITKPDIDALVSDGISEGTSLEYKEQPPGASDGDKKEFAADVTSFANAGGGDLGVLQK